MLQRIKDKWREYVLSIHVEHLYNSIGKDDILQQIGTSWWVGDKEVPHEEMKQIVAEAQLLKKTKLWRVLKTDIRYQANEKMFDKAKDLGDITMGKSWLWILDCIQTRITELTKIK